MSYGEVAISEGMQGPTFSKLGSQISAAKNIDVTPGSTLSGGQGMLILFSDMRDSLLSIQQNTLETVELLRTAITGDPAADRDANLSGSDTDTDDTGDDTTKKPGILSRVGRSIKGAASSLFGSTLGKLALAAGGFALLKIFGDDAIAPLADLIRNIKQGKIGENISKAYEYIKEVGVDVFEELKTNTILFVDSVKKMVKLVKTAFTAINDYVMSFDVGGTRTMHPSEGVITGGDGVLDTKELKNLRADVISKVGTYVADLVGDVFKGVLALIPLSQIVPLSVGLGFGLLKSRLGLGAGAALTSSMVTGGASATAAGAATRGSTSAAKFGMAGALKVAGIGLIVANSIFQTYQGITNALENSLSEDGTRDYSKFVAYFFGGNAEGGGLNAIIQANSVGGMFAGPAALIGLATFGFPGALIGGALGYGIGAIVGGIAGYMGAESLNDLIGIVGSSLKDGLIGIANFFSDFVEGVANVASGGSFSDAFDKDELDRKRKKLDKAIKRTGIDPSTMSLDQALATLGAEPENKGFEKLNIMGEMEYVPDANYMQFLQNKLAIEDMYKLQGELGEVITQGIAAAPGEIEAAKLALGEHLALGGFPAIPGIKSQAQADMEYDVMTQRLEKKLKDAIEKEAKFKEASGNLTLPGNLQSISKTQLDKINRTNSISGSQILNDLTNMMSLNDKLNKDIRPFIVDNNNDKSVNQLSETHLGGNQSQDRPNNSGKILSSKGVYQDLFF